MTANSQHFTAAVLPAGRRERTMMKNLHKMKPLGAPMHHHGEKRFHPNLFRRISSMTNEDFAALGGAHPGQRMLSAAPAAKAGNTPGGDPRQPGPRACRPQPVPFLHPSARHAAADHGAALISAPRTLTSPAIPSRAPAAARTGSSP